MFENRWPNEWIIEARCVCVRPNDDSHVAKTAEQEPKWIWLLFPYYFQCQCEFVITTFRRTRNTELYDINNNIIDEYRKNAEREDKQRKKKTIGQKHRFLYSFRGFEKFAWFLRVFLSVNFDYSVGRLTPRSAIVLLLSSVIFRCVDWKGKDWDKTK